MKSKYALLLSGGSGERLWPLSRRKHPKQLLTVKGQSLISHAVSRIESLFARDQILVVTTKQHAPAIEESVGNRVGALCIEPIGKNTAPAIYLAAVQLREQIDNDPVIVVMPTDHYIDAPTALADFLSHAIDSAASHNGIVLLGIQPTWAATGYGYIEYAPGSGAPYAVTRFHEKPQQDVAQAYLEAHNFLWNSGMMCARLSVILHAFETYAPEIVRTVQAYLAGTGSYTDVPSISNDYAILEKAENLVVLPAQFPWCDVGSIETFLGLQDRPQDQTVIEIDSHNNAVAVQEGAIAFIGVSDLCVVQHEGVLLIAKRGHTEQVRAVVDQLKRRKQERYLE